MPARKRSTSSARQRGTSKVKSPKTKPSKARTSRARYQRLPDRSYRDTKTGQVFSRYAYDKVIRGGKLKPTTARKAMGRGGRYRKLLSNYTKVLANKYGVKMTQKQVEKTAGFRQAYKDLHSKSNAAKGPKAKALEAFGLRDEGFPLAVGSYEPHEYRAMIRDELHLY